MTYLDFTDLDGMKGNITDDDIQDGIHGSCQHCPVARALERMFLECTAYVESDAATISDADGNTLAQLTISDRLWDWIEAFDNENRVHPIPLQIHTWNIGDSQWMLDRDDSDLADDLFRYNNGELWCQYV